MVVGGATVVVSVVVESVVEVVGPVVVDAVAAGSANACAAATANSSTVAMPAIHHPGRGIGRHYRRKRSHDSTPMRCLLVEALLEPGAVW